MLLKVLNFVFGRDIVRGTLMRKKGDEFEFSKTAFTMFISFAAAIFMALYDLIAHGFRFDVFCVLLSVALTGKIADRFSKKLQPNNAAQ